MKKHRIFYKSGYKYQLDADYSCQTPIIPDEPKLSDYIVLDDEGLLIIKNGYAWDGASGPTIDTKNTFRGSLVHDAIYQLMREGKVSLDCREIADQILRGILRQDGMTRLRSWIWYKAVRWCARKSSLPGNKRKTHTAP